MDLVSSLTFFSCFFHFLFLSLELYEVLFCSGTDLFETFVEVLVGSEYGNDFTVVNSGHGVIKIDSKTGFGNEQ